MASDEGEPQPWLLALLAGAWAWFWVRVCGVCRRSLGLGLRLGPMPQHMAFIMDGNRRFASSRSMEKIGGHRHGYKKLMDVIHWCLELGVPYVSVYAFSIDNFQRSKQEVESLMALVVEGYDELSRENGLAEREGVCVRVLGEQSLAPASVQGAAARMMAATARLTNRRSVLNVCFAYNSTEDVVQAVDAVQAGVADGSLAPADVTTELLDECLRTCGCPPVDLLVRTSGEARLSDFLTWQARDAQLAFLDCMWPEFGWLDFARAVLRYQRAKGDHGALLAARGEGRGGGGGGGGGGSGAGTSGSGDGEDTSGSGRVFEGGGTGGARRGGIESSGGGTDDSGSSSSSSACRVSSFLRRREAARQQWVVEHKDDR